MRRSGVSIALVAALLLALGSTAPSAAAAVEVTAILPNVGSIVSIAFDPESDHLFLYPEYGREILEFTTDGRQVDGIPVPGTTANDIDLDFALESLTVGGQSVPANTLLVGNGDGGNILYAIDKSDGSIEAQQVAPSNSIVGAAQNPPGDSFMTLSWTDDVINDFDPADGDLIRSLPVIPAGAAAFDVFYGDVDVDRDNGNIFVVSSSQNVIRQLSNSGQWLADVDVYNENNTTAATNMHAMSGIAIDDDRNIAYVSSTSGTVWRVSDLVGTSTEPQPEPELDQLLQNGSFEEPAHSSAFVEYAAGTAIGPWQVGMNGVDHLGPSWEPADGNHSVDMNGSSEGSISQDVATVAGETYTLTFSLAANPSCAPPGKTLDVYWESQKASSFSFDSTGRSTSDMGWVQESLQLRASGSTALLEFISTTPGSFCGPALDEVSLVGIQGQQEEEPPECGESGAICGDESDEDIEGTPEDEFIYGGDGNDQIDGGGGEDVIVGGGGEDVIVGGGGGDVLTGGAGPDVISGGAGNDKLFGDARPSANPRPLRANGVAHGSSLQDEETEVSSDDELNGGAGNDKLSGGGGNDGLKGGTGIDSVQGGSGNDAIGAGGDKDTVDGGAGNDKISGEDGNDSLKGAAGNDVLKAGAGVDKMNGGPGKDTCVRSSRKDKTISCERKPLQPPKGAVRLRLSRY